MVHIKVKRGLDIPIVGGPDKENLGKADINPSSERTNQHNLVQPLDIPKQIAFDCAFFEDVKFRLLVKPGDIVKIGTPLAEDKEVAGRFFASPAAGTIAEICRGEKRRLLSIVIDVASHEEYVERVPLNLEQVTREELLREFMAAGLFAHIRSRPFNRLADPRHLPRSIFVKAIESEPFMPSAEMQVMGHSSEFQAGLLALQKLSLGAVHVVYREGTSCQPFSEAKGVEKHTVTGPHPASSSSLHIQKIDPIRKIDDVVWTVTVLDVISIGRFVLEGKIAIERIVSLAGSGVVADKRGYYRARLGYPISQLVHNKLDTQQSLRLISGTVLTGQQVEPNGFLGFKDTAVAALIDATSRQFLSFLRLGVDKYTASGTYVSGHMSPKTHRWDFTTSQHGEERAFIDGSVYERVLPLNILPLQLVRAIMAEDYELAESFGLLEIDAEDFALPEFVCPCKIQLMDIVRLGIRQYAKDMLG